MVKHISFDMWGTLIQGNPHYWTTLTNSIKVFMHMNFPKSARQDYSELLRAVSDEIEASNCLTGRFMSHSEMAFRALVALGASCKDIEAYHVVRFLRLYTEVYSKYRPSLINLHATQELFQFCREREITLSVLSNTKFITGDDLRTVLKYYELLDFFKFLLFSNETGCSKPHVNAFIEMKLRLPSTFSTHNCLHVGDSLEQDGAAINFGYRFLQIHGDTQNTIESVYNYIQ